MHSRADNEKSVPRRSPSVEDPESLAAWPIPDDDELERAVSQRGRGESVEAEIVAEPKSRGDSLSRTLSRRSATSSRWDPGPAPDGGVKAWTQAAMAHFTIFSTWGWITSYGVFQEYYRTSLGLTPSTISWIGSVQIFLLFFLGTFSGRALDAGLFRPVYITGSVLQLLGVFSMSEATNFWQLFLSQGLCLGIANGLHFCPAMSLVSTYFVRKRALVVGIAAWALVRAAWCSRLSFSSFCHALASRGRSVCADLSCFSRIS